MGDEEKHSNRRIDYIKSRLPQINNPMVVEIFGILLGDGWIGISGKPRLRKQVCFCGNLKSEVAYKTHIQKLLKIVFHVNGYYKKRDDYNTYYILINSETIFNFFHANFDFPICFKKSFNIYKFPKSWHLQRSFIRGIFDTDGSTFFDHDRRYKRPYPVLDITLKNTEVLDWLSEILNSYGFSTIRSGKWMRLKGSQNFNKWFKEIAPKNSIHMRKYSKWITTYFSGS
ncbi:MAG: hypothetical protein ABID61_05095 [Candidatus Micrarchaeota archaeon]